MFKQFIKRTLRYPYGSFLFDLRAFSNLVRQSVARRRAGREAIRALEALDTIPTFMDIGAAGGLQGYWQYYSEKKQIDAIAFDLNDQWGAHANVAIRKFALGDVDGDHDFFITKHPGCSSCREPNAEIVRQFARGYWFEVMQRKTVRLNRFATLVDEGQCRVPHFVKIDAQGFECECLEGFGKYLPDILAIELEVNFKEMYKGQKLFNDVCRFMDSNGFVFRGLEPQWFDRFELVEANAFFSRKPRDARESAFLKFWECNSGLWHALVEGEKYGDELKRIESIPR